MKVILDTNIFCADFRFNGGASAVFWNSLSRIGWVRVARHRDQRFRRIVITRFAPSSPPFGMVIGDFGMVIAVSAGS